MRERIIKGDDFTMTENRPEWLARLDRRVELAERDLRLLGRLKLCAVLLVIAAAVVLGIGWQAIHNGIADSPSAISQEGEIAMSTRTIHVGDWNAQGLLPVEIADRTEEGSTVKLLRFTPEEARELEHKLHEANAERDE